MHPETINKLFSELTLETINKLFSELTSETINKLFSELTPETKNKIFSDLTPETINIIFSRLYKDTIFNLRLNQELIIKILMNCSYQTLSYFFINYNAFEIILSFNHDYDYATIENHFKKIDNSNKITIYTKLYEILNKLRQSNKLDAKTRSEYIIEYYRILYNY